MICNIHLGKKPKNVLYLLNIKKETEVKRPVTAKRQSFEISEFLIFS